MRSSIVFTTLPLTLVLLLGVPTGDGTGRDVHPATREGTNDGVEVRRIRAHFDTVLIELAARDVGSLSESQRQNRTSLVATLLAYRDGGLFPHNYDFPYHATPYFVDRKTGVLCAVGHLLASTGRRDIVDRVAQSDNNVKVPALAGDSAFTTWLDEHGLTIEEAARIQPWYNPNPPPPPPSGSAHESRETAWKVGAGIAVGTSAVAALWNARSNADGHSALGTSLGLTSGVLSLAFGGAAMGSSDAPPLAATASLAAGVLNTWLSTRGLLRHRRVVAEQREFERRRGIASVSIAPLLPIAGEQGAGLAVSIRY